MLSDLVVWADRNNIFAVGRSLMKASMRSMLVVVNYVLLDQIAELAFVPDDRPVEQLVTQRPNPPLRERVRCGARAGVRIAAMPAPANTASNDAVNWPPR